MKVVPTSITSCAHTDSVTIPWVMCTLLSPQIYYNGFERSNDVYKWYCWQGETHIMIPQTLERIRRFESGVPSYNTGSSTIYDTKKWKDQLRSLMASCEIVKATFKQQALKQSQLIQVYKVLCKWFTTIH